MTVSASKVGGGAVSERGDSADGLECSGIDGDVGSLGGRSCSRSLGGSLSLSSLGGASQLDRLLGVGVLGGGSQRTRLSDLLQFAIND